MADSNTIIAATLKVDASSADAAGKSISEMKDQVKQLTKEFENAKAGSTAQVTAYNNLKAAQDQLNTTTKSLSDSASGLTTHFKNIKEGMGGLSGPLSGATEGVSTLSTAFKTMLANPVVLVITAIVAALGFLYKAFTNSFAGGEKMAQVFAGIKAAAGVLLDSILNIGSAIIKLFSGDFKGAFADAKAAVDGVVHGVVDAYNQVSALTKKVQDLHAEQLKADLAGAQRQAQIAKLRELATDETVPLAKRKDALVQLKALSEKAAADDIALAQKTTAAKIALLSVGKDAELKNRDEITKLRIDAVNKETQAAQEGRAIGRQLKQVDAQERAKDKAAAAAAREAAKKDREQMQAYNAQLTKLQQQNALAGIVDQYTKEKQLLENKIADEANLIAKEYADKKITRTQFEKLNQAQQENATLQRAALTKKHQDDVQANEQAFQDKLADIRSKTAVDGIVNQIEKEKVVLQIEHQKELAQAIKDYGDDAAKLFQIKQALDAEYAAKQAAIDAKNAAAAAKKKLDDAKKHTGSVLNDPKAAFKERQAAIDAEQAQVQAAFDNKAITESEYNDKVRGFSDDRLKIKKAEQQQEEAFANATGDLLSKLSEVVGASTQAGKDFAIAGATIKAFATIANIIEGFSEMGPWGIAAGIAVAAATAIDLFQNIKKIESVSIPGQGSGGSSVSAPALPTAPVTPAQHSTQLNTASINAMGSAVTQSNANAPVKAYVLDSDVANNRDRDARLSRAARLGG